MKKNLCTLLVTLFFSILAAPSNSYAEGTPDGENPAEESVCDELKDGTPGLYGLCVAYCEAQDQDLAALMKLSPRKALRKIKRNVPSEKILRIYNRKKTAADPDMPCLIQDEEICPCYTQAELGMFGDMLPGQDTFVSRNDNPMSIINVSGHREVVGNLFVNIVSIIGDPDTEGQCILTELEQSPPYVEIFDRVNNTTAAQTNKCIEIFLNAYP